jgi:hypothetical protein
MSKGQPRAAELCAVVGPPYATAECEEFALLVESWTGRKVTVCRDLHDWIAESATTLVMRGGRRWPAPPGTDLHSATRRRFPRFYAWTELYTALECGLAEKIAGRRIISFGSEGAFLMKRSGSVLREYGSATWGRMVENLMFTRQSGEAGEARVFGPGCSDPLEHGLVWWFSLQTGALPTSAEVIAATRFAGDARGIVGSESASLHFGVGTLLRECSDEFRSMVKAECLRFLRTG